MKNECICDIIASISNSWSKLYWISPESFIKILYELFRIIDHLDQSRLLRTNAVLIK